jgi:hypothetical protein
MPDPFRRPPVDWPKKPSKYKNRKVELDGYTFDSQAEANRYAELKLLERAGKVTHIILQPQFDFYVGLELMFRYFADFSYLNEHDNKIIEDVKGPRTPVYRLKKKLIEARYGIKITEIDA